MSFEYLSYKPKSNTVKKIAFILHGYGVNASYVAKIAHAYHEHLDDLLVITPQAPEFCDGENHGDEGFLPVPQQIVGSSSADHQLDPQRRQWFGIETSDMAVMIARMKDATRRFNSFANDVCAEYDLSINSAAITGFSQGGSVALCAAYMRDVPYRCAISHSSIFFNFSDFTATCPTYFLYGDNDEEFSLEVFRKTAENIKEHASDFEVSEVEGLTHKTDDRSREKMARYLSRHL